MNGVKKYQFIKYYIFTKSNKKGIYLHTVILGPQV